MECKFCNNTIPKVKSRNIFCSRSCAASYNNIGVRRRGSSPTNCLNCKGVTSGPSYKYCSMQCLGETKRKTFLTNWLSGQSEGRKGQVSNYIRKWLLERAESKCQQCGWNEINTTSKSSPLVVDHIDGNSDNNRPNNLRILCPNCDSLTSTYKNLNKGNGRFSRRQRYKEGKSY